MTQVVTYTYAYIPGTIILCTKHERQYPCHAPPLGQVAHGSHKGHCTLCDEEV